MKLSAKKGDILVYIFIAALIAGSFLGLRSMKEGVSAQMLIIEVDGKIEGSYDLKDLEEGKEIRIDAGQDRYNIVTVKDNKVLIKEASCPDQLCVKSGSIRSTGQTIICLPNKVVVRIAGSGDSEGDIDDIAS